jgi:hypothetical protein
MCDLGEQNASCATQKKYILRILLIRKMNETFECLSCFWTNTVPKIISIFKTCSTRWNSEKSVPDPDHFGGPGSGFAIINTNRDPSIDEQKD